MFIKAKSRIINILVCAANKLLLEWWRIVGPHEFFCFHTALWVIRACFEVSDQIRLVKLNQETETSARVCLKWQSHTLFSLAFFYEDKDNEQSLKCFYLSLTHRFAIPRNTAAKWQRQKSITSASPAPRLNTLARSNPLPIYCTEWLTELK